MQEDETNTGDNGDTGEAGDQQKQPETVVPVERFNQVYGQMKNLERDIASLKEQKGEGTLTAEQQKELQAKTYLKGLLKETLEEQKKAESEAEKAEQAKFESQVNDIIAANPDIKRSEFLSFMEKEGDDYSSVNAALKGYQRLKTAEKEGGEKAKDALEKKKNAALPGSEGAGSASNQPPPEDKNKSLWQIAQEAAASLRKK